MLKVLEKEAVDVVILDIKMPGIDGIETQQFPLAEVKLLLRKSGDI
jgi:CheY-like chemotaxis protein